MIPQCHKAFQHPVVTGPAGRDRSVVDVEAMDELGYPHLEIWEEGLPFVRCEGGDVERAACGAERGRAGHGIRIDFVCRHVPAAAPVKARSRDSLAAVRWAASLRLVHGRRVSLIGAAERMRRIAVPKGRVLSADGS